jgi:Fic family protein
LGRLEGASARLDPERLLYMYVRKEAVLTSQIEGTHSTLSELLEYESAGAPGTPTSDVREVARYVDALFYTIEEIRSGALPLCVRLLRNAHARLMSDGRGSAQAPGELRRTQNWVGGTRPGNATYVSPPPHEVAPALANLERYLHDELGPAPALVKAGIAHAQFETIHPFLDGNGRIGRLLISLMLVVDGALTHPYFYISLYFKKNRADYYDALQRIRTHGDWEGWLRFFLIGVEAVAEEAAETARALSELFSSDRARVEDLGRAAPSALKVYDLMLQRIVLTPSRAVAELDSTWPTVLAAFERLEALGIATEVTGKKRNRLWRYAAQLEILERETNA